MLYRDSDDAVYAYGSNEVKPINYEEEPYTFWNLVDEYGENYANTHPDTVVEAMEQYHFFYNAKSTERAAINKFWSLSREERVDVLYEYFNENIDYWQKELEKEKDV